MSEVGDDRAGRAARAAVIAAYVVACLEVVLMSTPFAAYFYGVYSPVLSILKASPNLLWLDEFFLSHISEPRSPLLQILKRGGVVLAAVGLLSFLTHAAYLYWVRFRHGAVATRLLYAWVRHPQYLALMVAGVGLTLMWPRFLGVVLLLLMCVTYDALARFEERRMTARHADAYERYAGRRARFVPGGPGERLSRLLFGWLPGKRLRVGFAWVCVWALSLAAAFTLRGHSVGQLTTIVLPESPSTLFLAFDAPDGDAARRAAIDALRVSSGDATARGSSSIVYLVWEKKLLRHFLIDGGVAQASVGLDSIPDAGHYAVLADVRVPRDGGARTDPRTALTLRAVRSLRSVLCVATDRTSPHEISSGSLRIHAHASLPVL